MADLGVCARPMGSPTRWLASWPQRVAIFLLEGALPNSVNGRLVPVVVNGGRWAPEMLMFVSSNHRRVPRDRLARPALTDPFYWAAKSESTLCCQASALGPACRRKLNKARRRPKSSVRALCGQLEWMPSKQQTPA